MAVIVKEPEPMIFVHIRKNAGTSITLWLTEHCGGERIISKHCVMKGIRTVLVDPPWSFTVVRNPWDRAVSGFSYHCRKRNIILADEQQKIDQFNEWVYTNPATHYINNQNTNGVDYVMRFERLTEDFNLIQDKLRCYEPLPVANKSDHRGYIKYYTEKSKDFIAKNAAITIEEFDYRF